MFPNPAEDLISFNGTDRIDEIRVFDSAGRMVALEAPSGQRANIDLSSWNSGFYMYSVLMEDGRTKQGTFIKQ